jgi:TolB-like protein
LTVENSKIQQSGTSFRLGDWRVEPNRNAISRGDDQRHLENRLMQTLVFLADNQGQTVTREQFFDSVWKGLVVNEEALSRAISLLRTALDDNAHAPNYIQTIPGVGYRLIAKVALGEKRSPTAAAFEKKRKNSIAVLPFVNLSEDPANEYFSDGITEEILNVLAQINRFKVVGRTSSFAFKDRNKDLRKIGKALNVSHVLEGSVRKAGNQVRITAQLISTDDGYHLWSKTFDRELGDIFAIQDDIAAAISNSLKSELLGAEQPRQTNGGTNNAEAYQAYLMGMHYRNRGALRETVRHAADAFQRAIDLDPGYSKAYAGLAFTWNDLVWNGYESQENGLRQMNLAASKAIELAPGLADGHLALGLSLQMDYQKQRSAENAINRAMDLNPGNTTVLIEYSRIHCNLGNHEASIVAARRALELDPVSVYANHWLGHALYFSRQYEEAIDTFRQALKLDSHYPKPHYFISLCQLWLDDPLQALEEIQHEPLTWMRLTASVSILHELGRIDEAAACFRALIEVESEDECSVQQAGIYAQQGEIDLALKWLYRAYELGDPGLTQLKINPSFDPLRSDMRFKELLVKVGFAELPMTQER